MGGTRDRHLSFEILQPTASLSLICTENANIRSAKITLFRDAKGIPEKKVRNNHVSLCVRVRFSTFSMVENFLVMTFAKGDCFRTKFPSKCNSIEIYCVCCIIRSGTKETGTVN